MNLFNSASWERIMKLIGAFSTTLYRTLQQHARNLASNWTTPRTQVLDWNAAQAKRIEDRIQRQLTDRSTTRTISSYPSLHNRKRLLREERNMVSHVKRTVRNLNRSNITRTTAYARMYSSHPELHWAMLAHLVSRNGGWGMTDLQGDLLPSIQDGEYRMWTYRTLERCNALIFHDAYPQLMIYAMSRRYGKSLFHLLPHFDVSSFMMPFWESFWIQPNSPLLTIALIINEQNVIEGRVVQNEVYRKQVLDRKDFALHGWLQMNQVIFPAGVPDTKSPVPLYGLTLERFDSLKERIGFGKQLYTLLFDRPEIHAAVTRFIHAVPHTGSRADYWPHYFTSVGRPKEIHSHTQAVTSAAADHSSTILLPLYSPKLDDVWRDDRHEPIEPGDWLHREDVLQHLFLPRTPQANDLTAEHLLMWEELYQIAKLANSNTEN